MAFDLEDEVQRLSVDLFGNDLTRDSGSGDVSGWTLPLPTTYLIGRDSRIELASVDVDYRQRIDPRRMLDRCSRSNGG